ncbi:FAD/NAD(P)-binding protein, partial [Streptococcus pyogenes]
LVKSSADFVMKGKDGQSISVNGVVNATGYQLNSDNQQKADPILKSLLYQELAQISSEGGLTIDPQSMRVISPKYGILPTLY